MSEFGLKNVRKQCKYLSILILICLAIPSSNALRCHCDICPPETNHTCETDGLCFASTSIDDAKNIVYSYRYSNDIIILIFN